MEHPLCAGGWTHLVSFNRRENPQGKDEEGRLEKWSRRGPELGSSGAGKTMLAAPSGEKRKVSVPGLGGT